MVADPEECDMSELSQLVEIENHLAVFCVATYGEGDPTDNAQEFFEFLQNGDEDLNGLQYTVSIIIPEYQVYSYSQYTFVKIYISE